MNDEFEKDSKGSGCGLLISYYGRICLVRTIYERGAMTEWCLELEIKESWRRNSLMCYFAEDEPHVKSPGIELESLFFWFKCN